MRCHKQMNGARLVYNYYRTYDPTTGRYLQADPIGILKDYSDPQMQVAIRQGMPLQFGANGSGLNHLYGYVNQNPLSAIDPFGLDQMNRSPYAPGGGNSSAVTSSINIQFGSTVLTPSKGGTQSSQTTGLGLGVYAQICPKPDPDPNSCSSSGSGSSSSGSNSSPVPDSFSWTSKQGMGFSTSSSGVCLVIGPVISLPGVSWNTTGVH